MAAIRIDWQRVALNIRRAGLPLAKASERCQREPSWLGHVARGEVTRMEFHNGLDLLDLHLKTCGEAEHLKLMENASC